MATPNILSDLGPNDAIVVATFEELVRVEDLFALRAHPDMTASEWRAWQGREPIEELLRPPGYKALMGPFIVRAMEHAFRQLHDPLVGARPRKLTFKNKERVPTTPPDDPIIVESFNGVELEALRGLN